jgi:hypothetical protein
MRSDFLDDELFGNEAGEDENKSRLLSYYLEKPENDIFFRSMRPLAFVRARKGVGKSALLSYAQYKLERKNPKSMYISVKASELISIKQHPSSGASALEYTNYWQECLCTRIAIEIGRNIKIAASDDSMMLVETAELLGYKGRNIVTALCDRFTQAIPQLVSEKKCAENAEELLKRYSKKENIAVWFFIDDIDATFINTPENKMLVSTFFSACRNIVNAVKGLFIRASVRTDVWAIIKDDEALDKCEQYMVDLKWSTEDTGRILANKILTYYENNGSKDEKIRNIRKWYPASQAQVFDLVFNGKLPWGSRHLDPYRPIHILSAGRPRWAAQLCKMAANDAYKKSSEKISIGHINAIMFDYGKYRLSDLYKEHTHQCPQLKHIIESFRNGQKAYKSSDLLSYIKEKVISNVSTPISIEDVDITTPLDIAHFLYRIGFITLDDDSFDTGESFIRFEDVPDLLIPSNYNPNDLWVIHPSYRTILHLR